MTKLAPIINFETTKEETVGYLRAMKDLVSPIQNHSSHFALDTQLTRTIFYFILAIIEATGSVSSLELSAIEQLAVTPDMQLDLHNS